MSVSQSNMISLFYEDENSKKRIISFLDQYNQLYEKTFGKDHLYLGGFPLDQMYYYESEEVNVVYVYINGRRAWYWGVTPLCFSVFLESGICSKVVWNEFNDNGIIRLYQNKTSGEDAFYNWKAYAFDYQEKNMFDGGLEYFIEEYQSEHEDDDDEEYDDHDEEYWRDKLHDEYPGGLIEEYTDKVLSGEIEVNWCNPLNDELEIDREEYDTISDYDDGDDDDDDDEEDDDLDDDDDLDEEEDDLDEEDEDEDEDYLNDGGNCSFCPNCGARVEQGSKFCCECGASLSSDGNASNSSMAAMLSAKCREILASINNAHIYSVGHLDDDKVSNAIRSYAQGVDPNEILLQVDETAGGAGTEGCIIANTALYAKGLLDFEPRQLPLTPGLRFSSMSKQLYCNGEKVMTFLMAGSDIEKIAAFLNALVESSK